MSNHALSWTQSEATLLLTGTLNRESLLAFWKQRDSLLKHVELLNVSGLHHVDSTGLAMLVRLKGEFIEQKRFLNIIGMSDNLLTLMELYSVKSLLLD